MKRIHASVMGLLMAITGSTAMAQEVTLNLSNEYAANSIHGVGDARFAEVVKELTGGQVQIVVHYGGALGYKSADHFDAVGEGALEIADTYGGALGGIDPLFLGSSLPFVVTTVEEAKVLYEVSEPTFKKIFEDANQILLYASPWPPSGILDIMRSRSITPSTSTMWRALMPEAFSMNSAEECCLGATSPASMSALWWALYWSTYSLKVFTSSSLVIRCGGT